MRGWEAWGAWAFATRLVLRDATTETITITVIARPPSIAGTMIATGQRIAILRAFTHRELALSPYYYAHLRGEPGTRLPSGRAAASIRGEVPSDSKGLRDRAGMRAGAENAKRAGRAGALAKMQGAIAVGYLSGVASKGLCSIAERTSLSSISVPGCGLSRTSPSS